jgi:hypothetical protein
MFALRVGACDENGYPTDVAVKTRADGEGIVVPVGETAVYTVIIR